MPKEKIKRIPVAFDFIKAIIETCWGCVFKDYITYPSVAKDGSSVTIESENEKITLDNSGDFLYFVSNNRIKIIQKSKDNEHYILTPLFFHNLEAAYEKYNPTATDFEGPVG